ncbi:MAG: outer membrane protein transport protein [Piscirickettsiaceae bacterium]|nr:outer membrane protein transport protein [Piscirickettsiaceae bacterium]
MKKFNRIMKLSAFGITGLLISTASMAQSIGSDFNLKFNPTSAAMGGVGYVAPQDAVASVYGNAATLTQLKGDTDFTFGATYANVDNTLETGGQKGDIEFEHYLLPTIAVRQRITDKLVLGGGLQLVSGLGADYRSMDIGDPTVTFMTFGANMAAGYALTPNTSIGASMTLAYSILEIGLISNTGIQETFGVRGGFGITHDLGPVMLSANYNSELNLDFDNVVKDKNSKFQSLTLEQPQEFIVGVASTPAMWSNLLVEANVIYKNWDNSELYQDIWKDTYTFQLGGQYALNSKIKLRAGYSYTTDLLKKNGLGNSVGKLTSLEGVGDVNPAVIQFIQSSLADPFWNNSITAGLGYAFTDSIHADVHVGYGWGSDQTVGANKIETSIYTAGGGVTWEF